jgi:hypothetical protein
LKKVLTMGRFGAIGGHYVGVWVLLTALSTAGAFGDTFVYDFDDGFQGWQWQWDIWGDPNHIAVWGEVTLSDVRGYNDGMSLKFDMGNGWADNGTLWIENAFAVPANTPTEVSVSFQLWNARQSDLNNFGVTSCISDQNPEVQDDFTRIGWTDTASGWVQHGYQQTVTSSSGQAWVAVGIRVAYEAPRVHWIDRVEVSGVVPEPATAALLCLAPVALLRRHPRGYEKANLTGKGWFAAYGYDVSPACPRETDHDGDAGRHHMS